MDNKRIRTSVILLILIFVVDIIAFLLGNYVGLFQVLSISSDGIYSVDNVKLIGVIALTFFNIIAIYHNILKFMIDGQRTKIVESVHQYVNTIDQGGNGGEGSYPETQAHNGRADGRAAC